MKEIKKIVMIDDEKAIQILAKMALEKVSGFEVVIFNSGTEALENISGVEPDVILLDVIMPEMDGPEVYLKLKELPELAETPIVFLTGKTEESDKEKLLALGAKGVIGKPFDPAQLGNQIKEIYES